jgi:hypothetical protein
MSGAFEPDGATKLERATEAARRLLSSLPDNAEAAVVLLVNDPAVTVPEALTTDRDALLECLDAVHATEATGDAERALSQSFRFLRDSTVGGGAVHVFSDLQEAEWAADADRFDAAQDRIGVIFHRIDTPPRARANVAVTGVQHPERRAFLGQPYDLGLVLRNDSDSAADIRVHSMDAGGERNTESIVLSGREVRTVRVPVTIQEAGHHWVRAWIEGDDFAADNTAGIGLACDGLAAVRFAGRPDDYGVLSVAMSPSGQGRLTGLVTQFGRPSADANAIDPVLVVTTWDRLESDEFDPMPLRAFAEEGGNLLVVPSTTRPQYTASGRIPSWLGASIQQREAYPTGVRLRPANRDTRFWREISRTGGEIATGRLAAYAFYPLDLSAEFIPLLEAGPEKVVLAHRALGQGNVFVCGTAFSPRWNTIPLSGFGVVVTHYMAAAGDASSVTRSESLIAGQQPHPPSRAAAEVEIISLVGDALEWKGRPNELPVLPRAGVFVLTSGDERHAISVRASEREGEHEFAEGDRIAVLGPIAHTVVRLDADTDFTEYRRDQAAALGLFVPLLLLATLALLVEGLIGAPRAMAAGRDRTRAGSPALTARAGSPGLEAWMKSRRVDEQTVTAERERA